jgi:hypothetical protein
LKAEVLTLRVETRKRTFLGQLKIALWKDMDLAASGTSVIIQEIGDSKGHLAHGLKGATPRGQLELVLKVTTESTEAASLEQMGKCSYWSFDEWYRGSVLGTGGITIQATVEAYGRCQEHTHEDVVWENERWTPATKWSGTTHFPGTRSHFSHGAVVWKAQLQKRLLSNAMGLPSSFWEWCGEWHVVDCKTKEDHGIDGEGKAWYYAFDWVHGKKNPWEGYSKEDKFGLFVRRRQWVRSRRLKPFQAILQELYDVGVDPEEMTSSLASLLDGNTAALSTSGEEWPDDENENTFTSSFYSINSSEKGGMEVTPSFAPVRAEEFLEIIGFGCIMAQRLDHTPKQRVPYNVNRLASDVAHTFKLAVGTPTSAPDYSALAFGIDDFKVFEIAKDLLAAHNFTIDEHPCPYVKRVFFDRFSSSLAGSSPPSSSSVAGSSFTRVCSVGEHDALLEVQSKSSITVPVWTGDGDEKDASQHVFSVLSRLVQHTQGVSLHALDHLLASLQSYQQYRIQCGEAASTGKSGNDTTLKVDGWVEVDKNATGALDFLRMGKVMIERTEHIGFRKYSNCWDSDAGTGWLMENGLCEDENSARLFIEKCQQAGTCFSINTAEDDANGPSKASMPSDVESNASLSERAGGKHLYRFFPTAAFNDNNYVMTHISKMMCVPRLTRFVTEWLEKMIKNYDVWDSLKSPRNKGYQGAGHDSGLRLILKVRHDFLDSLGGLGSLAAFAHTNQGYSEQPHPLGVAMSKIVDVSLLLYGSEVAKHMYAAQRNEMDIPSSTALMKMVCTDMKYFRDILSLAVRGRFPLVPVEIAVECAENAVFTILQPLIRVACQSTAATKVKRTMDLCSVLVSLVADSESTDLEAQTRSRERLQLPSAFVTKGDEGGSCGGMSLAVTVLGRDLAALPSCPTPTLKLGILVQVCKKIGVVFQEAAGKPCATDDLIPILGYLFLVAWGDDRDFRQNIAADIFMMGAYIPKHQENGIEAYCLSVLHTTVVLHLPSLLLE